MPRPSTPRLSASPCRSILPVLLVSLLLASAAAGAVTRLASHGLTTGARDVAASPDGRFAVVRTQNGVVFYRLDDGARLGSFALGTAPPDGTGGVLSSDNVAVSPDGSRTVAVGGAGPDSVAIFDTGGAVPVLLARHALLTAAQDLAIAPDGRFAVVRAGASGDGLTFYSLADGSRTATFLTLVANPGVDSLAISPDSRRVVALSGAGVGSIIVLDTAGGTPSQLRSHQLFTAPHDLEISPDGRYAVVRAGNIVVDGIVFVRLSDGQIIGRFPTASLPLYPLLGAVSSDSVAVSPDSSRAVVLGGAAPDAVQVFATTSTSSFSRLSVTALPTVPHDVAISPDGRLAAVRSQNEVTVLRLGDGAVVSRHGTLTGPPSVLGPHAVDSLAFSPDGRRLVALGGAGNDTVVVLDTRGAIPAVVRSLGLATPAHDVEITPDGALALVRAGAGVGGVTFVRLADGRVEAAFGTAGATTPSSGDSVAVDPRGRRAVAAGAVAVQVFALARDLAVELLVATFAGDNVLRYDGESGAFAGELVAAGSGGLDVALGMAVGPDGDLYVASRDTDRVLRYDGETGAFRGVFAAGGLDEPTDLVFGPDGHLYVSSFLTSAVVRFHGRTGQLLGTFTVGGPLAGAEGLAFGPDGHLYVTSPGTDQVLRYDGETGAFLGVAAAGGGLDGPGGLAFGPDGHLYVGSIWTDRVLRYHGRSGAFLGTFAAGGGLGRPIGVRFGPDGHLYVASQVNDRILRYDGATGAFLGTFAAGGGGEGWTWFVFNDARLFADGFESGDLSAWSAVR